MSKFKLRVGRSYRNGFGTLIDIKNVEIVGDQKTYVAIGSIIPTFYEDGTAVNGILPGQNIFREMVHLEMGRAYLDSSGTVVDIVEHVRSVGNGFCFTGDNYRIYNHRGESQDNKDQLICDITDDDPEDPEYILEQNAFYFANTQSVPEDARKFIADLWRAYCLREK